MKIAVTVDIEADSVSDAVMGVLNALAQEQVSVVELTAREAFEYAPEPVAVPEFSGRRLAPVTMT